MTDEDLTNLIRKVSLEVFGKPFLHSTRFNGRLRTTGGRYMLSDHSVQINPLVVEVYGMEELIGVVKHELCHYHLHIEGKGFRHRDADFKNLLLQTSSPRFCQPLTQGKQTSAVFHFYKCKSCGLEYKRRRRVDIQKYRCGKCSGAIVEV